MEINFIDIRNYKSIIHLELKNLNNFSVFVGPNASGKSNIFEALEFFYQFRKSNDPFEGFKLFGKAEDIIHHQGVFAKKTDTNLTFKFQVNNNFWPILLAWANQGPQLSFNQFVFDYANEDKFKSGIIPDKDVVKAFEEKELKQFYNFSRLFIGNSKIKRNNYIDDSKLNADASNLESVLKRVLKNEDKRSIILEELSLLIPGFENIEIRSDEISGTDSLLIFEKGSDKPFNKHLISDGTYNIIALLTAVYQSEEPQFLCIEEPENGLNPFVAREFVRIFRNACEDYGHFIWINTHSQSILSELKQEEVIIVDKINGGTVAKQITGIDLKGLRMDEALFANVFGGGTPW